MSGGISLVPPPPPLGSVVSSDTSVAGVSRFPLDAHSARVAKRTRVSVYVTLGLGISFVAISLWLLLSSGALPTSSGGFVLPAYTFSIAALLLVSAVRFSRSRSPVTLLVRPDSLAFEYSDGASKVIPWELPSCSFEIRDQRGIPATKWFSELSPFYGWFTGLPSRSSLVVLPEPAVGAILDMARNRGLSVDSSVSNGGSHQPPAGTRIFWVHWPTG